MRKSANVIKSLLAVASASLLLSGCHHKDLCYEYAHLVRLKVVYDWRDAPEASVGGMRVFFYSEDDPTKSYYFDLPGTEGGYVEVPEGNYRIISYNNDTKTSLFGNIGDFDTHYCYTREGNILEPIYGNGMSLPNRADDSERVVICPDEVYLCRATDVSVSKTGITYTVIDYWGKEENGTRCSGSGCGDGMEVTDQIITLYPHDILCHYTYEVRNVKNIEHISQVSGAISGMAPSIQLCDETLHTEPVTIPVPGTTAPVSRASGTEITGSFLTFGHNVSNGAPHKMTFYVITDDGSKYQFGNEGRYDVTDQVRNAPDRRHVHIIIDGLEVPDPEPGDGGGFVPDIDNWGYIEGEVIM